MLPPRIPLSLLMLAALASSMNGSAEEAQPAAAPDPAKDLIEHIAFVRTLTDGTMCIAKSSISWDERGYDSRKSHHIPAGTKLMVAGPLHPGAIGRDFLVVIGSEPARFFIPELRFGSIELAPEVPKTPPCLKPEIKGEKISVPDAAENGKEVAPVTGPENGMISKPKPPTGLQSYQIFRAIQAGSIRVAEASFTVLESVQSPAGFRVMPGTRIRLGEQSDIGRVCIVEVGHTVRTGWIPASSYASVLEKIRVS